MPTYEYICRGCGHRFEVRHHMGEKPAGCPLCSHSDLIRVFQPTPFIWGGLKKQVRQHLSYGPPNREV